MQTLSKPRAHGQADEGRSETIREFVRRKLNEARSPSGQRDAGWPAIAKATGVPYFTLCKIAQGVTTNPTAETIEPLLAYFDYPNTHLRNLPRAA